MKDLFPQIGNERLDFQFVMKDFKIDKTKNIQGLFDKHRKTVVT